MEFFNTRIILLFILSFSLFSCSQTPTLYRANDAYFTDIAILEDKSLNLTLQDILSDQVQKKFCPNSICPNLIKHPSYAYWVRCKIVNSSGRDLILHSAINYSSVQIYIPIDSNKFIIKKGGINHPSNGKISYKGIAVAMPNFKEKVCYFRFTSSLPLGIGMDLYHTPEFINLTVYDYFIYGFYYGIFALAFFYSLIMYFVLKEKSYIFYSLYVMTFGCTSMVNWGLMGHIPYINHFQIGYNFYFIPYSLTILTLIAYSKYLLGLADNFKKLNFIINGIFVLKLLIIVLGITFKRNIFYHNLIDLSLLLICFTIALIVFLSGRRYVIYFLVGLAFLTVGFFENYFFKDTNRLLYLSGIFEIGMFAIALISRLNFLKIKKDKIQSQNLKLQEKVIQNLKEKEILRERQKEELEEIVKQRTEELTIANEEIARFNSILKQQNVLLEKDVKKVKQERILQKELTFEEFQQTYSSEESCLQFLAELKWKEGYHCIKCSNDTYSEGNTYLSRRCNKCRYIESVTAHTIFHHLKFPILKAFYILILICSRKNITVQEISDIVDLRKSTCWSFRQKVKEQIEKKKGNKNKSVWTTFIRND